MNIVTSVKYIVLASKVLFVHQIKRRGKKLRVLRSTGKPIQMKIVDKNEASILKDLVDMN